jgi:hypothetical protein
MSERRRPAARAAVLSRASSRRRWHRRANDDRVCADSGRHRCGLHCGPTTNGHHSSECAADQRQLLALERLPGLKGRCSSSLITIRPRLQGQASRIKERQRRGPWWVGEVVVFCTARWRCLSSARTAACSNLFQHQKGTHLRKGLSARVGNRDVDACRPNDGEDARLQAHPRWREARDHRKSSQGRILVQPPPRPMLSHAWPPATNNRKWRSRPAG